MPIPPFTRSRHGWRRSGAPLLVTAAICVAGLAAVPVGASPNERPATAATPSGGPSNGPAHTPVSAGETNADEARAFSACMRANGVPDFPDVTISEHGRVSLDPTGSGADVLSAEYSGAERACASLLPEGSTLPERPRRPSPSPPPEPSTEPG